MDIPELWTKYLKPFAKSTVGWDIEMPDTITGILVIASLFWAGILTYHELRKKIINVPGLTPDSPKMATPALFFDEVKYQVVFNDGKPKLTISMLLSSMGVLLMESAEVEISGKRSDCNWEPWEINSGIAFSQSTSCEKPAGLTPGKHNMRMLIFANGEWWESGLQTLDCALTTVQYPYDLFK
ncbi:MAG: hypothetical protein ACYDHZ_06105 [Dehalococcoidia bacterium]